MAFIMTAMLSSAPSSQFEFLPPRRKGLALVSRPVSSRSATLHAYAASQLGAELIATYGAGRGSSSASAWMLLSGLEIHLGSSVLAPDLIGWRHERLPRMSRGSSGLVLTPDWVCEVLSHPDERAQLLPLYAQEGIRHVWLVDPEVRTLEVLQLDGRRYSLTGLHSGTSTVRAEPFGALELPLRLLWAD